MKRFFSLIITVTLLAALLSPKKTFAEMESIGPKDTNLIQNTEDKVYAELINEFNSEDFIIDNVQAVYISEEYLEELAFNSQKNIYFGFTLDEIYQEFKDKGYVFTLGEDNTTVVKEIKYYDNTFEKVVRNLAVGTGVILLFVTASVVTKGLGLTTVSMFFAAAADTGTKYALKQGSFGAVIAGLIKGLETGDADEAFKAAALRGSETFKWGAILGTAIGGIKELHKIHKAVKAVGESTEHLQGSVEIADDLPQWRQAELRALNEYGGYDQLSYLDGKLVDYGTPGATRPDVVRYLGDHLEAVEVKYYNLNDSACLETMYNELQREVMDRVVNLPAGSTQRVVLDVTNRLFSMEKITSVVDTIRTKLDSIYPDIPIEVAGFST